MSYVNKVLLKKAGTYLLSRMSNVESVKYSDFYDQEEIERERAERETGLGDETLALLDFAIFQLEQKGIVKISHLETTLPDGEVDYQISWTDQGRELMNTEQDIFYEDIYT